MGGEAGAGIRRARGAGSGAYGVRELNPALGVLARTPPPRVRGRAGMV